jgi:hypothetical protein
VAQAWSPRLAALLAALWAGALLTIGGLAAPAAFAVGPSDVAGRIAGRLFGMEARIGIGVAVVLVLLLRPQARRRAEQGAGSLFSPELGLVLAAVFCTVAGYFALQPMMADARAGQGGALSFGQLHALSAGFFGVKALLVVVLAWRLTAR